MSKKDFAQVTRRLRQAARDLQRPDGDTRPAANVSAVQAQIDAIARGDLGAALANADPDLELEIFAPPEFPWVRFARGLDAIATAIAHNFGSVEHQTPVIHNVITQQDTVVLFGEEQGVIRATGAAYHVQFVHRFTFSDGRLRSVRIVAARSEPPEHRGHQRPIPGNDSPPPSSTPQF